MTSRGQNTNYHQKYLFRVRLVRGESMYGSPGKKSFWKKPGNKNIGKKSEFSEVLGKNVTGNNVLCFGFLGARTKVLEN